MTDTKSLNPIQMAYMGDAVCEAYIREKLLGGAAYPMKQLHRQAVAYVNAVGQSEALARIESVLSDEECDIVRRGRNAKTGSVPKHASPIEYARATAFEALLGYLHLTERYDRLRELLDAAYGGSV